MNNPEPRQLNIISPPPVLYIGTLLPGFAAHAVSPIGIFPTTHAHNIPGGFLFVLSGVFARWAFLTMRDLVQPRILKSHRKL